MLKEVWLSADRGWSWPKNKTSSIPRGWLIQRKYYKTSWDLSKLLHNNHRLTTFWGRIQQTHIWKKSSRPKNQTISGTTSRTWIWPTLRTFRNWIGRTDWISKNGTKSRLRGHRSSHESSIRPSEVLAAVRPLKTKTSWMWLVEETRKLTRGVSVVCLKADWIKSS